MSKISIRFWGVRGSTPSPFKGGSLYGGNTPCLEIRSGSRQIICDAGTGIRLLGREMVRGKKKANALILLSHIHWDHISGLPFFNPLYVKGNRFEIIGPKSGGSSLKKALGIALSPPYFPVSLLNVPASLKFQNTDDKPFRRGGILIQPFRLSHPGSAIGWRFHLPGRKSIVYVSDNEPDQNEDSLIKWAEGADIMIHDAQYTPVEYRRRKGWGHSPYTYPVRVALSAGVKNLILNHFDPTYTDRKLKAMLGNARRLIKRSGSKMECSLASEGKRYTV